MLLKSFGCYLFFKFFSPSSELVLIKARPSFEEHSKQRSAGKVSPSSIKTTIPTFKSEDLISWI
jgi:hypothetical protein